MNLDLSPNRASFLASQLRYRMLGIERELAHTDKHELQHALASDLDALQSMVDELEGAVRPRIG
jgi:hypothetical protein